jgi:predicted aldo/keto reductase-like oxidoreductase
MDAREKDDVTRRRFLQGAAAAGMAPVSAALAGQAKPEGGGPAKGPLGRTGLQVSRIGLGGRSGRILRPAVEAGINLVHNSTQYGFGSVIREMGAAFAKRPGLRERLVLCLKGKHKDLERELDGMLKALHTDHADVYLPQLLSPDRACLEGLVKLQDALKAKGKIRFKGFVCHVNLNEVLEMVLGEAPGFFDAALLATQSIVVAAHGDGQTPSYMSRLGKPKDDVPRFMANLGKLKKQGLGVISMKSGTPQAMAAGPRVLQAHLKTVLAGGADTVLCTLASIQQMEVITGLDLATAATPWERRLAREFHGRLPAACLMCGACARGCPRNIPVSDLMRIRLYQDEYCDAEYARLTYDELGGEVAALASNCGSCTVCHDACPVGLASAEKVRYVTSLFS